MWCYTQMMNFAGLSATTSRAVSRRKDHLLSQYEVQLHWYAFLLVKNGYKKLNNAALFYFQPASKRGSAIESSAPRD